MQPRIAISIGDYNGIGPEVVIKAVHELSQDHDFTPVILGSTKIIDYYLETLDIDFTYNSIISSEEIEDGKTNVLECLQNGDILLEPGKIEKNSGKSSMQAVETGINLCSQNKAHALVTAPISKEAIQRAGYPYPGHTEFLANKTHCRQYMMLMVNDALRIGLVSIHIPVSEIISEVTKHAIIDRLQSMHTSLVNDFGIRNPKIGVLGLNPHAGDGGVIGKEEIDIIRPALEDVHNEGI
ncbi:MAG TPA: 4-hydroxythreonine-4-phosphate dehydrogenase PdxA, partial [Balneolales bacterium]|nr:4-hydroxythreonine-4-phosphate dehydrogenase PdxA [Balneolales bacterium]